MSVPAAISLVTLGVRDLEAATQFYVKLGFPQSAASVPGEVSFFRTKGATLALYGVDDLAADAQLPRRTQDGFAGVSLAINVENSVEVDLALDVAESAGARILKPAQATPWGGYHGYFADPDGYAWEIAHNPAWPLSAAGLPILP